LAGARGWLAAPPAGSRYPRAGAHRPRAGRPHRLHHHRPGLEGSGRDRAVTLFRAPASTANLGPGFDVAGAALDLWNELELTEGEGTEESHLGMRAFSVYASPAPWAFSWTSRSPRERGLGSSAAVAARGLVAGAWPAHVEPSVEELLEAGLPLEGHADNLAAALVGGVCLTWDGRIARVADGLPALPIAVIPETRVSTAATREALPSAVQRTDAVFSVARAA